MNRPDKIKETGYPAPFIIAGPCGVESREQIMAAAEGISRIGVRMLRGGLWKPRTHPGSFEGVGEAGAQWLRDAGKATGMETATEVANAKHVEVVLKYGIDTVWIGARTTGNPFLVQEIADALKGTELPVLVKNPLVPDPELWIGAIERLAADGRQVCAVHRGFYFYGESLYRNAPFWQIPVELRRRMPEIPILCDPSHIGGERSLVKSLSQQAMAFGFDGLMIEVHPDPDKALSDAAQQITPAELAELIGSLKMRGNTTPGAETATALDSLRSDIDRIDSSLIDLLAERMKVSEAIGKIKEKSGLTVLQTGRWNSVLKKVCALAKEKDLDESFITEVFNLIHRASMERQINK